MLIGVFELACVTVTYNPDHLILKRQLETLPCRSLKIVIDNASENCPDDFFQELSEKFANVHVIRNEKNIGLAAALNQGARAAISMLSKSDGCLLLLDQDSEPEPGSVQNLLDSFNKFRNEGRRIGCVGPMLVDPATGLQHGFHLQRGWRWVRQFPARTSPIPVRCSSLNGSGTLMSVDLFESLGGLQEDFFIDHIDTEWAFRVMFHGYELWGIPSAVFIHRMGEESGRFWFWGWRTWPSRSPLRHFYLFRNAVFLMRCAHVPRIWKIWAIVKLILTACVSLVADRRRWDQIIHMARGIKAGSAMPSGK